MRIIYALTIAALTTLPLAAENYSGHGISLYGELKYGPDFTHFEYANPTAPKGGAFRLGWIGTFDSLNPHILKGISPPRIASLIYDTLTEHADDEVFSEYGRLAERVEVPTDYSWVIFTLRKEARWHDGQPVTPEDVIFTLETLKTKGHPGLRSYYASIEKVEKVGERQVKMTFAEETNKELPLIAGQLPILPKHYWEGRDFEATTLEPPLGSGPYKVAAVEAGRFVTYERVADYWGRDIPVNKGRYNFDRIQFDYYRDQTVAIEALKAGEFDYRRENSSKDWSTSYEVEAVAEGRLVKDPLPHQRATGLQAYWFNTRRSKFADRRVRQAIGYAFDFEWTNKNLFYGLYARSTSFYSNSELASSGLPEGRELEILEEYRDRVPTEVFTRVYEPPQTDGSGQIRANLRAAKKLLDSAGWDIVDGVLTHGETGEVMVIEFLLNTSSWERIVAPMISNLERLGVKAAIRTVDRTQYQNRVQEYDYDVISVVQGQSHSPGNEQRNFWTSAAADQPGSGNRAGIKDPVVDELVEKVIQAPSRAELVAATRALDRVLLWGHYVVPHWYSDKFRVIHWNKFGKPAMSAPFTGDYFVMPYTWWYDEDKAAKIEQGQ
jgi:microcin C transport system substrate-binding protein